MMAGIIGELGIVGDEYPNDADGDALRRVARSGNDMSKPMDVDFPVVVYDESTARQFSDVAHAHGYIPRLWQHEDHVEWDVICVKRMVLTYDAVLDVQRHLDQLSRAFGGHCDGWGTFGNKDM
jgi:hypothetical protein